MLITNVKPLPNVLSTLNLHTVTIVFVNGQLPLIQKFMAKERNQKDLPVLNGKLVARLLNSEMSIPHSKVFDDHFFDHFNHFLVISSKT